MSDQTGERDRFDTWDKIADGLASSPNPIEREHYFFGWMEGSNYPLLVSPQCRSRHIAFFGSTGSGKTACGMLPLTIQAILRKTNANFYLDHKGDENSRVTLEIEARRAGLPYKCFALESDKASFLFNICLQSPWLRLSALEKTQVLMASLGLSKLDEESGTSYFEGIAESVVLKGFELYPEIRSLRELFKLISTKRFRMASGINRRDFENSGALFANLRRLSVDEQLNAVPGDGHPDAVFRDQIDLEACISQPSVTYFRLPATIVPTTGRTVSRIVIRLLTASARRLGRAPVPTYVCIDEFQEVAQQSLLAPIRQAGDLGISFFMAQQTMSDLEGRK